MNERIKLRRTELGLSQTQLAAEVSRLEGTASVLTRATVAQWETGATTPKHKRLQHVAQALQTTVPELLGHADEAQPAATSTAPEWPIRSISAAQYAQLPRATQEQIEAFICTVAGLPPPIDWRTSARRLAASVDKQLKTERYTEFVNAVEEHHDKLAAEARERHAERQGQQNHQTHNPE